MADATIVFDDDCGFCKWCVEYAIKRGDFDIAAFSELSPGLQATLPPNYEQCVHLVDGDDVYSCGEAVEEALARIPGKHSTLVKLFRLVPRRAAVRDPLYEWVADNRDLFGRIASR